MQRSFTLLFLLLLIGQVANGQTKQPPDSLQPLRPVAERNRNPDYAAPESKQPSSRRRVNRPKVVGANAVPFGPNQAAPGATAPVGMPFRMSMDGKSLIIGQQRVEINNGELPFGEASFQMGLFRDSFTIPYQKLILLP